jgi:hypothetical protein
MPDNTGVTPMGSVSPANHPSRAFARSGSEGVASEADLFATIGTLQGAPGAGSPRVVPDK